MTFGSNHWILSRLREVSVFIYPWLVSQWVIQIVIYMYYKLLLLYILIRGTCKNLPLYINAFYNLSLLTNITIKCKMDVFVALTDALAVNSHLWYPYWQLLTAGKFNCRKDAILDTVRIWRFCTFPTQGHGPITPTQRQKWQNNSNEYVGNHWLMYFTIPLNRPDSNSLPSLLGVLMFPVLSWNLNICYTF